MSCLTTEGEIRFKDTLLGSGRCSAVECLPTTLPLALALTPTMETDTNSGGDLITVGNSLLDNAPLRDRAQN